MRTDKIDELNAICEVLATDNRRTVGKYPENAGYHKFSRYMETNAYIAKAKSYLVATNTENQKIYQKAIHNAIANINNARRNLGAEPINDPYPDEITDIAEVI